MTPEKVIAKYVAKRSDSECWLWTGNIQPNGYGSASCNSKTYLAHRFVYQHLVGPIPKGLQLDHLCRIRHCVNPKHLEPVTASENVRRGLAPYVNVAKTHCPKGHEYTEDNVYRSPGKQERRCRQCISDRSVSVRKPEKTHCPKGHSWTPENSYWSPDGKRRRCRACKREAYKPIKRTHCKNGHKVTPENTYVRPDGTGKHCKECNREAQRRYIEKKYLPY